MATITSSNVILTLSVPGVFDVPVQIQEFATDDSFETAAVQFSETAMSNDGVLFGGKVFVPYTMTINLMAASASREFFDIWRSAQDSLIDVLPCYGTIIMPGISAQYTLNNGILQTGQAFPGVKKTLAPVQYEIMWNQIVYGGLVL